MYLVLAVDSGFIVITLGALVIALVLRGSTAAKVSAAAVGICALLPLLIGVGGYSWGMSRVTEAVAYADPAYKDALMAAGRAEAMNNIWFGAGSLGCTLPAAMVVFAAAFLGGKREG